MSTSSEDLLKENSLVNKFIEEVTDGQPAEVGDRTRNDLADILRVAVEASDQKLALPRAALKKLDKLSEIIQAKISAQLDVILHDPDFLSLEASWRGLEQLVVNMGLEKGRMELRVMDVTKEELSNHIADHEGFEIRNSKLYNALYKQNIGVFGGTPITAIAADMYFGPSQSSETFEQLGAEIADDARTLSAMALIGTDCNAPFLSSITPRLLNPKYRSWGAVNAEPNDLQIRNDFEKAEYLAPWRSLRENLDSSFLGMTCHRILGRHPHMPSQKLNYSEVTEGKEENYCWVNGVFGLLENIGAACFKWDWAMQWRGEEGGGLIPDCPQHHLGPGHSIGVLDAKISNGREAVLSEMGFIPLLQHNTKPHALIRGGQSVYKPGEYSGEGAIVATERAQLQACLPYLFVACRLSHYATLKAWSMVGDISSAEQLQQRLNEWLKSDVILGHVDGSTPKEAMYKRPVKRVKVVVEKISGKAGYFDIQFEIEPHQQFEGANMNYFLSAGVEKK